MSSILSQEEIDALLRGQQLNDLSQQSSQLSALSPEEIDAIGEIGNISMGTSATTLSTLLNKRVNITTPKVAETTIKKLATEYSLPFVAAEISYTMGIEGKNLLIIQEDDVKIMTDLMMGGDGTNTDMELSELHLSAIGEVMNQMIGSSATSLSTMLNKNINISPPKAFAINFNDENPYEYFQSDEPIVQVKFRMEIEDLINSYIMQLLPLEFAKNLVGSLLNSHQDVSLQEMPEEIPVEMLDYPSKSIEDKILEDLSSQSGGNHMNNMQSRDSLKPPVNVRPVSFQQLEPHNSSLHNENIDLIMDVPLDVSVELGRTQKMIKEILELNPGSIIELDKIAGEPVDILVNGKLIAKGEVVVIEDSFGVRITDILSPINRISYLK